MSFFGDIRGKFSAGYQGRYLEHLLEMIANQSEESCPPILKPILDYVSIPTCGARCRVKLEYKYGAAGQTDRQADMAIFVTHEDRSKADAIVLVEIKINDSFIDAPSNAEDESKSTGQLHDYLEWCQKDLTNRRLCVLTAFPLLQKEKEELKDLGKHVYLSALVERLQMSRQKMSDRDAVLNDLLLDYLAEEGYCMFEPKPRDLDALQAFMVLNFLPHASGHGKVATHEKISRGPRVFSELVQNWQLITTRVAAEMELKRSPTVLYVADQGYTRGFETIPAPGNEIAYGKIADIPNRTAKNWGRYWLVATAVIGKSERGDVVFKWGQVLQVVKGNAGVDAGIYCSLSVSGEHLDSTPIEWYGGVGDKRWYAPEDMVETILTKLRQLELPTGFQSKAIL